MQYNPKLFVNTKESLQMTLKLFKDRIYYTAYIDDLEALVELCQATKGDKISVCGYPNICNKRQISTITQNSLSRFRLLRSK